jgi:ComF family protein
MAVAALHYRYPVDWLVRRFKFSRDLACGAVLANELQHAVGPDLHAVPPCIVPVPLHWSRQLRRGFNQSDLLAARLSRSLGLAVDRRLLRRTRRTSAQSGLDAARRRRNVRGAFVATPRGPAGAAPSHVALVDDVCTTGETLADCSRALRRIGVRVISIWIAARAPGHESLYH